MSEKILIALAAAAATAAGERIIALVRENQRAKIYNRILLVLVAALGIMLVVVLVA